MPHISSYIDWTPNYLKDFLSAAKDVLYAVDGGSAHLLDVQRQLDPRFGPEIRDVAIKMDCLIDLIEEIEDYGS